MMHGGDRRSSKFQAGKRPLEIPVWKQIGFSSRRTSARAKNVVKHGCKELIEAMDSGTISISAADLVADLSDDEQRAILGLSQADRRWRLRELREDRSSIYRARQSTITIPFDAQRAARVLVKRWPRVMWEALASELAAEGTALQQPANEAANPVTPKLHTAPRRRPSEKPTRRPKISAI